MVIMGEVNYSEERGKVGYVKMENGVVGGGVMLWG